MSSVVLDSDVLETLRRPGGRVEIRDEAGQLAGYFTPPVARSIYDSIKSPVEEEELRRRAERGGGRTLDAILKDLEQRP
jgi:hypothetical protein